MLIAFGPNNHWKKLEKSPNQTQHPKKINHIQLSPFKADRHLSGAQIPWQPQPQLTTLIWNCSVQIGKSEKSLDLTRQPAQPAAAVYGEGNLTSINPNVVICAVVQLHRHHQRHQTSHRSVQLQDCIYRISDATSKDVNRARCCWNYAGFSPWTTTTWFPLRLDVL